MSQDQISAILQEIASLKTMEKNIQTMMEKHEKYHDDLNDKFKEYMPIHYVKIASWITGTLIAFFSAILYILYQGQIAQSEKIQELTYKVIEVKSILNSSRIEK